MEKKKKSTQLPFRLNILFFVVFLLFFILIIQLGVVQILKGDTFQREIDRTEQDVTKEPVPRGKIYDQNHKLVVDNEPLYAITYTPEKGVQPEDRLELAEDLVEYMSMENEEGEITGISERNEREYWYLNNKEEAESRLSQDKREGLDTGEEYTEVLKQITEDELDELTDEDLEIIAIKKELDKAHSLTPQVIKNENVTMEEYARVAEHLEELPGVNVTTDWDRKYPNDNSFNAFLGSITSQSEGILAEKEQYYLTRGYSRNDRVGKSGLEAQYEDVLRGRKEQIEYITDNSGKVVDSDVLVPGERGKDLVLTVDMEYQEMIDKVVREELKQLIAEDPNANRFVENALAVVMNPKTGEILAVSGQNYNHDKNEVNDASLRIVNDAYMSGSVVKGATVLAGLQSGVFAPNEVTIDKPIRFDYMNKGDYKSSVGGRLGPVNDISAIERSSNVYMWKVAMRMSGNPYYHENMSLSYEPGSFQKMRNYFQQFGLGIETGIDYPSESTGYSGDPGKEAAGLLQDYTIGQFDTFTPLQLVQYVSTIANNGYRVRPHFVKEIRNPSTNKEGLGPLHRSKNTDVLNRVEMDQAYIERVQEGFRRAFQGDRGTGRAYFSDKDYNPAGKTGTAEDEIWVDGKKTDVENLALVGYAPFDDPEVAFAVIVPHIGLDVNYPINHYIGQGILDSYFDLQEEREKNGENDDES